MNARKLTRSLPRRLIVLFSACLIAGTTAPAARAASTLLSNGHPVHVKLPVAIGDPVEDEEGLFIVHGSNGYSVFIPPGATELRIDFQTTPGTVVELLAQADVDVGLSPATSVRL